MAATAVIAAVGLALSIGMALKGSSDQAKARKMAASNIRPTYNINQEEKDNTRIAEAYSGQGLMDASKQTYTQNIERGLTSGIDGILKGGGDPNDISKMYGMYIDSMGKLAIADDNKRIESISRLLDQNRHMSAEKDKAFQVNEYAPYADKAKESAQLYQQGSQWIAQGVNTAASTATTYAEGAGQRRDVNRVNGGGTYNDPNVGKSNFPDAKDTEWNFKNLSPEDQATVGSLYWKGYR